MRTRGAAFGRSQCDPLTDAGPTPGELAYWKTRILRLRYTAAARPGSENELFARLEHGGQSVYFPLETEVPEKGAARACEIHRTLLNDGWNAVRQRYVRQIVWAIYWFSEPQACTYTTLFTVLGQKPGGAKTTAPAAGRIPVALVESEPEVMRALERCINHSPGYTCVQTAPFAKDLIQRPSLPARQVRMVLFNQRSLNLASATFQQQIQARWPGVIALPFRIFGYSDEIFMNMTGVDRGYYLRRRLPTQVMEPLTSFWHGEPAASNLLEPKVRSHFQGLLAAEGVDEAAAETAASLTQREDEVLRYLGAGHTDKTISNLLGISVWTVHAHVKSIFEKLGVHTRAEAVMRYLQK